MTDRLPKPKILIVDDVRINIKLLLNILGNAYQLAFATSGEEALALVRKNPPDLILLDVIMPGMDGYEVCTHLQSDAATQEIPIIFLTSLDGTCDESKGLQLGAVDFITKPIRPPILHARVKTHIDLKRQRDLTKRYAQQSELRVEERTKELQASIVLLSREIAQRYQAEQELTASRLQLQAIVDTAMDGIITINDHGVIEFVNGAGENMFGYLAGELPGQNVTVLMSPPDRATHDAHLRRFLESNRSVFGGISREVVGRRRDDTLFPLDLSIAEIRLGDRRLFTAILRDISPRKKAEAFAIRSARLASLGTLAAGVSHEINNPNNAIGFAAATMGRLWQEFLPVLNAYRESDQAFEVCGMPAGEALDTMATMIAAVAENTKRIAAIITNLKHLARGDVANLNQSVDINKVVQSSVTILQNVIRKHTHRFAMTLGEHMPRITGNAQQLEQVFINLLQNALQALPHREKGVTLVTVFDSLGKLPQVQVSIQDQGSGIDQERMALLTKPFYTTKGEDGGIGLGLSITKTILDNHHGTMTFESEPGQGTKVTVLLPVSRIPEEDDPHGG